MKWLWPLCVLTSFCSLAHAGERRPFELGLNPSLSFSSAGSRFSSGFFFKVPVADRWQLKLADESLIGSGGSHRFASGVDYNFADDWLSSFFAGIGLGYQRNGYDRPWGNRNYWFGYAEAGKRFTLVRAWGLSYAPQVQVSWGPDAKPELNVMPVNLSLFF